MPDEPPSDGSPDDLDDEALEALKSFQDNLETVSQDTGRSQDAIMKDLLGEAEQQEMEEAKYWGGLAEEFESPSSGQQRSALDHVMEQRAIDKLVDQDSGDNEMVALLAAQMQSMGQIVAAALNDGDNDIDPMEVQQNTVKMMKEMEDDGDDGSSVDEEMISTLREIGKERGEVAEQKAEFYKERAQQQQGGGNEQLIKRLNSLENQLQEQQQQGADLSDQLEEYKALKDTLSDISSEMGPDQEQQVMDDEGSVDWAAVIDKFGDSVEKAASAIAQPQARAPPKKKVDEVGTGQGAAPQPGQDGGVDSVVDEVAQNAVQDQQSDMSASEQADRVDVEEPGDEADPYGDIAFSGGTSDGDGESTGSEEPTYQELRSWAADNDADVSQNPSKDELLQAYEQG